MSNQSDVPQPDPAGTSAGQTPATPPAGYEPPAGYQPPPAYQAPPAQGYPTQPQPGGQQQGFQFQMPADAPHSFNEVMPKGGFSGIFSVTGMPTELKVSYWIWVISGLLGILLGILGFFGSLLALAVAPAVGVVVLLLVLVTLALSAAQVVLAMKMKEQKSWARMALTAIVAITLVISMVQSGMDGTGGGGWFGSILGIVATVLMWLPNSQPWFAQRSSTAG